MDDDPVLGPRYSSATADSLLAIFDQNAMPAPSDSSANAYQGTSDTANPPTPNPTPPAVHVNRRVPIKSLIDLTAGTCAPTAETLNKAVHSITGLLSICYTIRRYLAQAAALITIGDTPGAKSAPEHVKEEVASTRLGLSDYCSMLEHIPWVVQYDRDQFLKHGMAIREMAARYAEGRKWRQCEPWLLPEHKRIMAAVYDLIDSAAGTPACYVALFGVRFSRRGRDDLLGKGV